MTLNKQVILLKYHVFNTITVELSATDLVQSGEKVHVYRLAMAISNETFWLHY